MGDPIIEVRIPGEDGRTALYRPGGWVYKSGVDEGGGYFYNRETAEVSRLVCWFVCWFVCDGLRASGVRASGVGSVA
jgi:hypothetical protein